VLVQLKLYGNERRLEGGDDGVEIDKAEGEKEGTKKGSDEK
jgi:hypothetical protein